jgi:hypothetical protein
MSSRKLHLQLAGIVIWIAIYAGQNRPHRLNGQGGWAERTFI